MTFKWSLSWHFGNGKKNNFYSAQITGKIKGQKGMSLILLANCPLGNCESQASEATQSIENGVNKY